MSIYATLATIRLEHPFRHDRWVEVWCQGVPGHIDDTGPRWAFLPPPVADEDALRAVCIVAQPTRKGTARNGQEYARPLLVLTGAEWAAAGFADLLARIEQALAAQLAGDEAPRA